jgi:hypothetical protein
MIKIKKIRSGPLQIAFGIGDIDANPDLFKILAFTRENGVIPNITINGARLTQLHIGNLAKLCGAVSVSNYDKELCYNTAQQLTKNKVQVNIHQLLSMETFKECLEVANDALVDPRLKDIHAVVYLSLKTKGRGDTLTPVNDPKLFEELLKTNPNRIGFDSCSSPFVFKSMEKSKHFNRIKALIEPCESLLFSGYINVDAKFYPCSFMEDVGDWKKGINVLDIKDFVKDIWNHKKSVEWRTALLAKQNCKCAHVAICRTCPQYKELICK